MYTNSNRWTEMMYRDEIYVQKLSASAQYLMRTFLLLCKLDPCTLVIDQSHNVGSPCDSSPHFLKWPWPTELQSKRYAHLAYSPPNRYTRFFSGCVGYRWSWLDPPKTWAHTVQGIVRTNHIWRSWVGWTNGADGRSCIAKEHPEMDTSTFWIHPPRSPCS